MTNIGKRIRFFRKREGLTLKQFGEMAGIPSESAVSRICQYESGDRSPRPAKLKKFSDILNVSTAALTTPNMESAIGVIHILFALEDTLGVEIRSSDGHMSLQFNDSMINGKNELSELLQDWNTMHQMVQMGQLDRYDYDTWRYQLGREQ